MLQHCCWCSDCYAGLLPYTIIDGMVCSFICKDNIKKAEEKWKETTQKKRKWCQNGNAVKDLGFYLINSILYTILLWALWKEKIWNEKREKTQRSLVCILKATGGDLLLELHHNHTTTKHAAGKTLSTVSRESLHCSTSTYPPGARRG